MPGSWRSRSTFRASNRATFEASNPSNARRYPSRFLRMVDQDNPACAPPVSPAGPPSQAGTDGFAIAALVLGILGVFGVVFGIIALRRIRRTGAHGRGLAIAGIVLSCSWIALIAVGAVLAAFGSAHRSSSGDLTVAGDVTLADLRVGDCVTSLPSGSVLTV